MILAAIEGLRNISRWDGQTGWEEKGPMGWEGGTLVNFWKH